MFCFKEKLTGWIALNRKVLKVEQDLVLRPDIDVPVARPRRDAPRWALIVQREVGARDHTKVAAAHIATAV